MNSGLLITMAVGTVVTGVTEKILMSVGKTDEAQWVAMATKAGMAVTALTAFSSFVKQLSSMGW